MLVWILSALSRVLMSPRAELTELTCELSVVLNSCLPLQSNSETLD